MGRILSRVAEVLHETLVAVGGRALDSFPIINWPFDTVATHRDFGHG
jgi:hypothetical protein